MAYETRTKGPNRALATIGGVLGGVAKAAQGFQEMQFKREELDAQKQLWAAQKEHLDANTNLIGLERDKQAYNLKVAGAVSLDNNLVRVLTAENPKAMLQILGSDITRDLEISGSSLNQEDIESMIDLKSERLKLGMKQYGEALSFFTSTDVAKTNNDEIAKKAALGQMGLSTIKAYLPPRAIDEYTNRQKALEDYQQNFQKQRTGLEEKRLGNEGRAKAGELKTWEADSKLLTHKFEQSIGKLRSAAAAPGNQALQNMFNASKSLGVINAIKEGRLVASSQIEAENATDLARIMGGGEVSDQRVKEYMSKTGAKTVAGLLSYVFGKPFKAITDAYLTQNAHQFEQVVATAQNYRDRELAGQYRNLRNTLHDPERADDFAQEMLTTFPDADIDVITGKKKTTLPKGMEFAMPKKTDGAYNVNVHSTDDLFAPFESK